MPQPDLILTPFAQDAPPSAVDPIPETRSPSDPLEKATWRDGFPSLTMIPLAAGGIPPRGQDFNGVLKAISEHTVFQGVGGQYKWDATIAAADGYPLGAVLQKAGNDGFWLNLLDGNTTNPDAGGADWIDASSTTLPYALDTGAANAYVATYTPALTALATGQVVRFKASNANTGASTFNPNGLGAKPIVSQSGAALSAGSIQANGHVWLQYDATIGGGSWVSLLSAGADTLNAPIAAVAAAGTINLTTGAPDTSQIEISGTGLNINGFTVAADRFFVVKMTGASNTLVDSASLVTGRGANIPVVAGDSFLMRSTAENTVEIVGGSFLADSAVGTRGQTWQDLTASRALSTTYTNTTGRAITVAVSLVADASSGADTVTALVDGQVVYDLLELNSNFSYNFSMVVPAGSTYRLNAVIAPTIRKWMEQR